MQISMHIQNIRTIILNGNVQCIKNGIDANCIDLGDTGVWSIFKWYDYTCGEGSLFVRKKKKTK